METDFRANKGVYKQKKAVNKRILLPVDKNSDLKSHNERFVKFPLCGKAASIGRNT